MAPDSCVLLVDAEDINPESFRHHFQTVMSVLGLQAAQAESEQAMQYADEAQAAIAGAEHALQVQPTPAAVSVAMNCCFTLAWLSPQDWAGGRR